MLHWLKTPLKYAISCYENEWEILLIHVKEMIIIGCDFFVRFAKGLYFKGCLPSWVSGLDVVTDSNKDKFKRDLFQNEPEINRPECRFDIVAPNDD